MIPPPGAEGSMVTSKISKDAGVVAPAASESGALTKNGDVSIVKNGDADVAPMPFRKISSAVGFPSVTKNCSVPPGEPVKLALSRIAKKLFAGSCAAPQESQKTREIIVFRM